MGRELPAYRQATDDLKKILKMSTFPKGQLEERLRYRGNEADKMATKVRYLLKRFQDRGEAIP